MNKKLFGIRIGTILSILLCLIIAVIFWFFVEYSALNTSELADSVIPEASCAWRTK